MRFLGSLEKKMVFIDLVERSERILKLPDNEKKAPSY